MRGMNKTADGSSVVLPFAALVTQRRCLIHHGIILCVDVAIAKVPARVGHMRTILQRPG